MSHKQIKLKIFPDGQVQAEVLGFRGKKCADYISILEQMLDAEAIDSERTPEYYLLENVLSTEDNKVPLIEISGRS